MLSIGDAYTLQYLSRVELAESTEMTPQQGNKIIFVLFLLQLHFHSTNQKTLKKLHAPAFDSKSTHKIIFSSISFLFRLNVEIV